MLQIWQPFLKLWAHNRINRDFNEYVIDQLNNSKMSQMISA